MNENRNIARFCRFAAADSEFLAQATVTRIGW
jgi:hypothetical protein